VRLHSDESRPAAGCLKPFHNPALEPVAWAAASKHHQANHPCAGYRSFGVQDPRARPSGGLRGKRAARVAASFRRGMGGAAVEGTT